MGNRVIVSAKGIKRQWQGIPGIEIAANGRLWCIFFSGGPVEPHVDNEILLSSSSDNGQSWSDAETVVSVPGNTRAFDPCLWHDPDGKLWLFYNTGNIETKQHRLFAICSEDSNNASPTWSKELAIELDTPYAFRLNKPTVLSSGEWLLPVVHADKEIPVQIDTKHPWKNWFAGPDQRLGVAVSLDKGKRWKLYGKLNAPEWALENMIIEKNDASLWMLIRTGGGSLWESFSNDKGATWTPAVTSGIPNPGSRFHIRRLKSGKLFLINHVDYSKSDIKRTNLAAMLSDDDGQSWSQPIFIDKRDDVSYPDMVEDQSNTYHIVYDRERQKQGEINYCALKESDFTS